MKNFESGYNSIHKDLESRIDPHNKLYKNWVKHLKPITSFIEGSYKVTAKISFLMSDMLASKHL